MLRLDHNRALPVSSLPRLARPVADIEKMTVWGNHSPTMYADYRFATIKGESVAKAMINDEVWNKDTFLPTVGKRGAAIIAKHVACRLLLRLPMLRSTICVTGPWAPTAKWVTMGIPSDGQYGIPKDTMFGFAGDLRRRRIQAGGRLGSGCVQPRAHQHHAGKELQEEQDWRCKHLLK